MIETWVIGYGLLLLIFIGAACSILGGCTFGRHKLRADRAPVNGRWWAFCRRCGTRHTFDFDAGKFRPY